MSISPMILDRHQTTANIHWQSATYTHVYSKGYLEVIFTVLCDIADNTIGCCCMGWPLSSMTSSVNTYRWQCYQVKWR